MDTIPYWLPVAFFVIAAVYSSAGLGGGSAYLAVMALIGMPYQAIPQTALACNLVVSGCGVWHYRRGGGVDAAHLLPFVTLSVPMAYVGGRLQVGESPFVILLAVSLLAAGIRMILPTGRHGDLSSISLRRAWLLGAPVAGAFGFLAGVVGIGGGVFLGPLLLLGRWADAKQTAALTSVFVLTNSAAGLSGQLMKGVHMGAMIIPLVLAAWLGGFVGSRTGAFRFSARRVQQILAAIIVVISVKLLWSVW